MGRNVSWNQISASTNELELVGFRLNCVSSTELIFTAALLLS